MSTTQRLNKFIALATGTSRREADLLIESEKVTVNGKVAVLGGQVSPNDHVQVGNSTLTHNQEKTYLLFHKPVGFVCSRKKQGDAETVYSLLPEEYHHLKPVGRLDKNSSGLLLFTNDGDFAHRMTHPSFRKTKLYEVKLDEPLEPLHQQMISDFGVMLEDGKSQLSLEALNDMKTSWKVIMSEGRNRQIRRTFSALGYHVVDLHRTDFGAYSLGELKSGDFAETSAR